MKKRRLLEISGITAAAAGVIMIAAGVTVQYLRSQNGYTGSVIYAEEEFATPRELVVITASMPITVEYGDVDAVKVAYTGGLPLIFSEDKGTLRITQNDTFTIDLFSPRNREAGVTVTLPHKVYERISLSSSGGAITSRDLNAGDLEFSTKGGDMTLYGIDEHAYVRTESGRIHAEFSSYSADMTINAGSGNVELLMSPESSIYLEFFTESGTFTSHRPDTSDESRYGDCVEMYNGAKNKLNVNTSSGDLDLYLY